MRFPCPRLPKITLALVAVLLPVSASAGTFRITNTSATELPHSATHIRVLGESTAQYQGAVDPLDRLWSINAHVKDDSVGTWHVGPGASGPGVTTGQIIRCDSACGADVVVARCTGGSSNSYSVRGRVATFSPNNPEIHEPPTGHTGPVLCLPEEPPEPEGLPHEDPLVVDLDRNGFHFTGTDRPVAFDIDADGVPELISWTSPDQLDAFLVIDHNRNGMVDDGSELFGNRSWLLDGSRAANGFEALAAYDALVSGGTADELISAADVVFDDLLLWIDSNHDGRSERSELLTLAEAGLTGIELAYREKVRTDRHGNRLVFKGRAWAEVSGRAVPLKVTDVFLSVVGESDL